jgi:hypothetical protein
MKMSRHRNKVNLQQAQLEVRQKQRRGKKSERKTGRNYKA